MSDGSGRAGASAALPICFLMRTRLDAETSVFGCGDERLWTPPQMSDFPAKLVVLRASSSASPPLLTWPETWKTSDFIPISCHI